MSIRDLVIMFSFLVMASILSGMFFAFVFPPPLPILSDKAVVITTAISFFIGYMACKVIK